MIGEIVRVLPPFDSAFPGSYLVERQEIAADGGIAYFLRGNEGQGEIAGGFDAQFLSVQEGD